MYEELSRDGKRGMKTVFYPEHHFKKPFPSDLEGGTGGMYECIGSGGVGNTKNSDRDVCKTMRASALWVGMCTGGM